MLGQIEIESVSFEPMRVDLNDRLQYYAGHWA
jgi:hypothetical protein